MAHLIAFFNIPEIVFGGIHHEDGFGFVFDLLVAAGLVFGRGFVVMRLLSAEAVDEGGAADPAEFHQRDRKDGKGEDGEEHRFQGGIHGGEVKEIRDMR